MQQSRSCPYRVRPNAETGDRPGNVAWMSELTTEVDAAEADPAGTAGAYRRGPPAVGGRRPHRVTVLIRRRLGVAIDAHVRLRVRGRPAAVPSPIRLASRASSSHHGPDPLISGPASTVTPARVRPKDQSAQAARRSDLRTPARARVSADRSPSGGPGLGAPGVNPPHASCSRCPGWYRGAGALVPAAWRRGPAPCSRCARAGSAAATASAPVRYRVGRCTPSARGR